MEENKEIEQELTQVSDTAEVETEAEQELAEELVIEKKRYSISYEMFDNAYTVFQKKYVYPRAYIMCGLLAALAVANIVNTIISGANSIMSYLLVAACLALAAINIYNPRKVKRNLMQSISGIENDVYTLEVYNDKLTIGTVLDPVEQRDEGPEEYEEVFGDTGTQPEDIQKSDIYINSTLRVTERAEYFMVYIKRSMFYVIPKHALTDDETNKLAVYFSSKLGKYFVCEADK